jgi:hypothetical protein
MSRIACLLIVGSVVLVSCGGRNKVIIPAEAKLAQSEQEVYVDAFLFDARLWRDGKPTSFRLELYQADTIAGLAGRGYLGKGALKGRITTDSMIVYFPSTNEYLRESIPGILGSIECVGATTAPNLAHLAHSLPGQWLPDGQYLLDTTSASGDERAYSISEANCPWRLDVTYTMHDSTWYVEQIEFDSGENTRFRANRRTLKTGTSVESNRFAAPIGPDAVRIIP